MKRNISHKKRKKLKGGNFEGGNFVNNIPFSNENDMKETLKEMNKPPIMHVIDYLLYTLYTLGGIFIYYPSFLVNIPDTTLEKIVPTEGGCKTLFGNELMCKRKIKCFFKKCSLMEDPQGFRLEKELKLSTPKKKTTSKKVQKIQLGGSKNNSRKKIHKYVKYIPYKLRKRIKQFQNRDVKNFKKLLKYIEKDNRQKGGNIVTKLIDGNTLVLKDMSHTISDKFGNIEKEIMKNPQGNAQGNTQDNSQSKYKGNAQGNAQGNEPITSLNSKTCLNRTILPDGTTTTNHVLCDLNTNIDYKQDEKGNNVLKKMMFGKNEEEWAKETAGNSDENFLAMLSIMKNFSGLDGNTGEDGINRNEIIETIIKENMDDDSTFKLLMVYKMLDNVFESTTTNDDINSYKKDTPDRMYGIDVSFPWHTKNPNATFNERKKCLLTHLTNSNLGDDYQTNDLYEKCFVCKNCTLANTSFKVWDKLVTNLFSNNKPEISSLSNDLFKLMKKTFQFKLYSVKQYYLFTILAMYFIHPTMNLQSLNIDIPTKTGNSYKLKDLILGIPQMTAIVEPSPMIKKQLRNTYMSLKSLDIETILYKMCYQMMYKKILETQQNNVEERLFEIKKQIRNKTKIFYGKQKIYSILMDNSIDMNELEKFHPLNIFPEIKQINDNEDLFQETEINRIYNKEFQNYIPLFQLLLDPVNYDKLDKYQNSNDHFIKDFLPILEKINQQDENEIEKIKN